MLELRDVAEVIVGGEPVCLRPAVPGIEPAQLDLDPGLHRGDRSDTGRVVGVVAGGGLGEQFERFSEVSLGLMEASGGNPPPVGVLREPQVFAKFCAGAEVVRSGVEVVVLDGEQAEADVHVGCAAQTRVFGGVAERRLEGALGFVEASLGALDVSEGQRAAHDIREVAASFEAGNRLDVALTCAVEVSLAPVGQTEQR
jgi:hypothetical protein